MNANRWMWPVYIGTVIALSGAGYCAWQLYNLNKFTIKNAQEAAVAKTVKTAEYVDHYIKILQTETNTLIQSLASQPLNKETIEKALAKKPVHITGLGIILDPQKETSGYYYVEDNDKQQQVTLSPYNLKKLSLPTNNGRFIGPITDPITGNLTVMYAQLLPEHSSIVFATQSLDHLNHILSTLHLGKNGYWILTDQNGTIIRHPRQEVVDQKQTMQELAQEKNKGFDVAKLEDSPRFVEYTGDTTETDAWLVFAPLPTLDWKLYGVFDMQQIPFDWSALRQYWMLLVVALLTSLILIAITYLPHIIWWGVPAIVSCCITVAIAALWIIAHRYPQYADQFIPIEDKIGLYTFLDAYSNKEPLQEKQELSLDQLNYYLLYRYKKGKYIPTGIYVKELELSSAEKINVVGYVWQRYFDGIHDRVSRGFILPQIAEEPTITELSRTKEGKTETIMWQMSATLNQQLSYTRYPFDNKRLTIELRHKDFDKQIILVPDLDAYQLINPQALPGLSNNIFISGWNPLKSAFEYQMEHYRTNFGLYAFGPFGIYKKAETSTYPILTFGTTVARNLVEALVTDILPLLVIALLLFICFITDVAQGFSGFVPSLAGIFFAALISHLSFRGKLPPHEIVYIETFYFILYGAMVAILILSMLNMFEIPLRWVAYKQNRIAKLLYWPLVLGSFLIATLWYLY